MEDAPKCCSRWRSNQTKGREGTLLVSYGRLRWAKSCEGTSGWRNDLSVVLSKDGESLTCLSRLLLLSECGEGLVALQARPKSGERSSCASYNWPDALSLPEKFVVVQQNGFQISYFNRSSLCDQLSLQSISGEAVTGIYSKNFLYRG